MYEETTLNNTHLSWLIIGTSSNNNIEGEVVKDNTDLKSLVLSSTLLHLGGSSLNSANY